MKRTRPSFSTLWLLLLAAWPQLATAAGPLDAFEHSAAAGAVAGRAHRPRLQAAPEQQPSQAGSLHLPLKRSTAHLRKRDANAVAEWAKRERARVMGRYGPAAGDAQADEGLQPLRRRQDQEQYYSASAWMATATETSTSRPPVTFRPETTGSVGRADLTNYLADLEYYASIQVGWPAENFSVILDTGSSDLWLASTNCSVTACGPVPRYNDTSSLTSNALVTDFSIRYGDGTASGTLFNDTVSLAGLNATSSFASCDSVSTDMLSGNVSGIMGLGFTALSASKTTPFWEQIVNTSVVEQDLIRNGSLQPQDASPYHNLSFPGFSFALTRYINLSHPDDAAPGGLFTLGTLSNESYTGNITYVDIPSDQLSYWYIPMDSIQLNSTNVTGIDSPNVAIDTGTTLIGGPSSAVADLYSLIPGAKEASGDYAGYWTYPCNSTFSVSFGFGGRQFNMTDEDFNLGIFEDATNTTAAKCLGAFFELSLSSGTASVISWVIGSAFLKNVYSVYRFAPNVSVGFADLNEDSLDVYYPYPTQPASSARAHGGGPFGPPTASGDGSASPTAMKDQRHNVSSEAPTLRVIGWTLASAALGCIATLSVL